MAHPEWDRSCLDCRTYYYEDDGRVMVRGGEPVPQGPVPRTPCHRCPKVLRPGPEPGWERAAEWTPEIDRTWRWFRRCRAVGRFPDDELADEVAAAADAGEREAAAVTRRRELQSLAVRVAAAARAGR